MRIKSINYNEYRKKNLSRKKVSKRRSRSRRKVSKRRSRSRRKVSKRRSRSRRKVSKRRSRSRRKVSKRRSRIDGKSQPKKVSINKNRPKKSISIQKLKGKIKKSLKKSLKKKVKKKLYEKTFILLVPISKIQLWLNSLNNPKVLKESEIINFSKFENLSIDNIKIILSSLNVLIIPDKQINVCNDIVNKWINSLKNKNKPSYKEYTDFVDTQEKLPNGLSKGDINICLNSLNIKIELPVIEPVVDKDEVIKKCDIKVKIWLDTLPDKNKPKYREYLTFIEKQSKLKDGVSEDEIKFCLEYYNVIEPSIKFLDNNEEVQKAVEYFTKTRKDKDFKTILKKYEENKAIPEGLNDKQKIIFIYKLELIKDARLGRKSTKIFKDKMKKLKEVRYQEALDVFNNAKGRDEILEDFLTQLITKTYPDEEENLKNMNEKDRIIILFENEKSYITDIDYNLLNEARIWYNSNRTKELNEDIYQIKFINALDNLTKKEKKQLKKYWLYKNNKDKEKEPDTKYLKYLAGAAIGTLLIGAGAQALYQNYALNQITPLNQTFQAGNVTGQFEPSAPGQFGVSINTTSEVATVPLGSPMYNTPSFLTGVTPYSTLPISTWNDLPLTTSFNIDPTATPFDYDYSILPSYKIESSSDKEVSLLTSLPSSGKEVSLLTSIPSDKEVSLLTSIPSSGEEVSLLTSIPSSGKEASLLTSIPSSGEEVSLLTSIPSSGKEVSLLTSIPSSGKEVSLLTSIPSSGKEVSLLTSLGKEVSTTAKEINQQSLMTKELVNVIVKCAPLSQIKISEISPKETVNEIVTIMKNINRRDKEIEYLKKYAIELKQRFDKINSENEILKIEAHGKLKQNDENINNNINKNEQQLNILGKSLKIANEMYGSKVQEQSRDINNVQNLENKVENFKEYEKVLTNGSDSLKDFIEISIPIVIEPEIVKKYNKGDTNIGMMPVQEYTKSDLFKRNLKDNAYIQTRSSITGEQIFVPVGYNVPNVLQSTDDKIYYNKNIYEYKPYIIEDYESGKQSIVAMPLQEFLKTTIYNTDPNSFKDKAYIETTSRDTGNKIFIPYGHNVPNVLQSVDDKIYFYDHAISPEQLKKYERIVSKPKRPDNSKALIATSIISKEPVSLKGVAEKIEDLNSIDVIIRTTSKEDSKQNIIPLSTYIQNIKDKIDEYKYYIIIGGGAGIGGYYSIRQYIANRISQALFLNIPSSFENQIITGLSKNLETVARAQGRRKTKR